MYFSKSYMARIIIAQSPINKKIGELTYPRLFENIDCNTKYNHQGSVFMRTTKVIAFSVPPDFETNILKFAKAEHRTISEYIREALRHYMTLREFDKTRKTVSKRLKKKGLKSSDVESILSDLRRND